MKKHIKRIVSLALVLSMIFSLSVCSHAQKNEGLGKAENSSSGEYNGYPFVLVRGMEFNGIYYKRGTSEEQRCFKGVDAGAIIKTLGKAIFRLVTEWSEEAFYDEVCKYLNDIFGLMACDKNGKSKYDVSAYEYPLSVANYPECKDWGTGHELGILKTACEKYGAENVYYFNYDWRLDPFETAEKINSVINLAKSESGKDKVNLVCCSMGGIEALSYMYKFGTDSLNKVIFLSSTAFGTHVTSDLLSGKIELSGENLYYFLSQSADKNNKALCILLDVLHKTKAFDAVCRLGNKIVARGEKFVYDKFLFNTFGTMPTLWALVMPECYDEAINHIFGGKENEYSEFIAMTGEYMKMAEKRNEILKSAEENGTAISFISGYDKSCVPVYSGGNCNGDDTLEADRMLGGAVVSKVGSTLGDDYVPADPSRLSPDRKVDLSGVLFPETTWAIRNFAHVGCSYNTDSSDFLFWMVDYDGRATVNSNPKYPQFMYSENGLDLKAQ